MTASIIIEALRGAVSLVELIRAAIEGDANIATNEQVQAELSALRSSVSLARQQADKDWSDVGGK